VDYIARILFNTSKKLGELRIKTNYKENALQRHIKTCGKSQKNSIRIVPKPRKDVPNQHKAQTEYSVATVIRGFQSHSYCY